MSATQAPTAEYHDREAWLARRAEHLTASEIMAALGKHEFMTPADLQRRKLLGDEAEQTDPMLRGTIFEDAAVKVFEIMTGLRTRRQPFRVHPDHPLVACSVDRQIIGGEDRRTGEWVESQPLEAKAPGSHYVRKLRQKGLPDYIIGQVQTQADVWKKDSAHMVLLDYDRPSRSLIFAVERDPEFCAHMIGESELWWERHIVNREPVPLDPEEAEIAVPEVKGEIVQVEDPEWIQAVEDLLEAKDVKKEVAELEKAAKAKLAELTGGKGAFEGGGFRVYYKELPGRVSFQKKALEATKPLDRMSVATFVRSLGEEHFAAFEELLPELALDLSDFEKRGKSYEELRTYRLTQQMEEF